ncbi:HAMP domain-containing protein [Clostridium sp. MSJ-11]|uniref:histidine kinase n=1 Tax=Clostridium mobile TaxID=2841512 RepID=A0ABS6EID0_9CLOT|nr:HAMP domain-containing sensor histidine kinase [Clostridium mobile]MBU5484967.1 HAMP domain-containing protein [Clostridium mobile]
MKKKFMLYMFLTLLFSLTIVVTSFIIIVNYQNTENTKKMLKANNQLVINILENAEKEELDSVIKKSFNGNEIRVTIIDRNGVVVGDSKMDSNTMENHNNREEIILARTNGSRYAIRHSDSTKIDSMYFTTLFNDGYVVRSAIGMKIVSGFEKEYGKYYIMIILISIIISIFFSSKFSMGFVKPIKDLEFITSRITAGELDRRVNIYSKDEIGQLSRTFNKMADKLQLNINDVIDKQNKLEAILTSMDSGVIAVDKNFRVIMINPYANKIFGIDKDIIGCNLLDYVRSFELEDILKNTVDEYDEYREIKILSPKERDLRIRTADINNGRQLIGTVAVVQDVTDIKRLENMRSQFVANVSHELKTPLTSIKGFAETLRYVEDSANKEKFLNIINDEAERLTRLINDILALSHIENNKDAKQELIDVDKVVEDVCHLVSSYAKKKNISLNIEGDKCPRIYGDTDRFKQIILNLVDNGIKYTEDNAKVLIKKELKDKDLVITIKDTGVGIPKEDIGRIFERFYRVDKARSRAEGGTGLGLAIVKHIVLSFNGRIDVESEVGKGSKFIVTIPIVRA